MEDHSNALLATLNQRLNITYNMAPLRQARGQTYKLYRGEKPDPAVGERLLEKLIWKRWRFQAVAEHNHPFHGDVCRFIQTYQMPLQGTRKDTGWGKVDLVGATPDGLPVVIELKEDLAKDPPLRMLVEGLAYACAVRRAWHDGRLREEWAAAMSKNGLHQEPDKQLTDVPVILLAPVDFWDRAIGSPGVRTSGKVRGDTWPVFSKLVEQCRSLGYPIYFAQFEKVTGDVMGVSKVKKVGNVSAVHLPIMSL